MGGTKIQNIIDSEGNTEDLKEKVNVWRREFNILTYSNICSSFPFNFAQLKAIHTIRSQFKLNLKKKKMLKYLKHIENNFGIRLIFCKFLKLLTNLY